MKSFLIIVLVIFSFFGIQADDNLLAGRETAENICSVCHGVDGLASSAGNSALVPNLIAQNKLYLIEKLLAYKSGALKHHQMGLIAQMLSEQDIKNVSAWYSQIKIKIISNID